MNITPTNTLRRVQESAAPANPWLRTLWALLTLLAIPGPGAARPGNALTINLTLSPGSDPFAPDPGPVQLTQLMQAAADHWESIIHDNHTIEIIYGYQNLAGNSGMTCFLKPYLTCYDGLGDLLLAIPDVEGCGIDTLNPNGTPHLWFYDPTPEEHSEFAMQQQLYRDLSDEAKTLFFSGNVPDLLEVAYFGQALPAAPANAKNGGDMFSLVLHEMGHAVGPLNELALPDSSDGFDFGMES